MVDVSSAGTASVTAAVGVSLVSWVSESTIHARDIARSDRERNRRL